MSKERTELLVKRAQRDARKRQTAKYKAALVERRRLAEFLRRGLQLIKEVEQP